MIKSYKALILAALLAACGGQATGEYPDYDNTVDAGPDSGVELGQTGQALTADIGYGSEPATVTSPYHRFRCLDPWNGGSCYMPKQKVNKAILTCFGCSTNQLQGMADGNTAWRNAVNANGFTITDTPAGQPQNIYIYTGNNINDPDLVTKMFSSSSDDVSNPLGTFKRWTSCETKVNFLKVANEIATGSTYGTTCKNNASCQKIVYANWIKRAAGICTGLGMNPVTSPIPSADALMAANSTILISPSTYSPTELAMLKKYKP